MLKELKKERNIRLCHMSELTGLGKNTIKKFDNGEKICDEKKRQIEIMLEVIEENDIVFPSEDMSWRDYYKELYQLEAKCKYLAVLKKHADWP